MTKVPGLIRTGILLACLCVSAHNVTATQSAAAIPTAPPISAKDLYAELGSVGLDPHRVYDIRDASLDRTGVHITLEDGTIGFTKDVEGRITGAFFSGYGDVLVMPPNQVERGSMALFTGGAILEERFSTAYFRFNDETFRELEPSLRETEKSEEFVALWDASAIRLASVDELRLFLTFSEFSGGNPAPATAEDRFLHARLQGLKLGTFDVYYDTSANEQVWAAQLRVAAGQPYYDVWASFNANRKTENSEPLDDIGGNAKSDAIHISSYKIRVNVQPPTQLDADASLQMEVRKGGNRTLLFEFSRFLELKRVEANGTPVEFIHNNSSEGTQRARRGNDIVAVVLPKPLQTGERVELRFEYGGKVLSDAGQGLLYVGERGTWYPNRGMSMAKFDLEFHYPSDWNLVATGELVASPKAADSVVPGEEKVSRWVSDTAVPLAGFNLGKYTRAEAKAGSIPVESYATRSVEKSFPKPQQQIAVIPPPTDRFSIARRGLDLLPPLPPDPSPARNVQEIADISAHAVDAFSRWFGPYPYRSLKLTQMPGRASQGWPGLIFLSSYAFISDADRAHIDPDRLETTLARNVILHETAHQWWGDLIGWSSYRDQWMVEALANYSALMLVQADQPERFHEVMRRYRDDLLEKQKNDAPLMNAGPVTLGLRLSSSEFPGGYHSVSYGRGTWLLHMLRCMMLDGEAKSRTSSSSKTGTADPFIRTLRSIRERYAGKSISTRELLQAFEENLPKSLWYENRKSLDWFYEDWINGTAIPHLALHNVKYSDTSSGTTVTGIILQEDAPQQLVTSVPIYAVRAKKTALLGRVFADGPATQFRLMAPAGVREVALDPNQTVLSRGR